MPCDGIWIAHTIKISIDLLKLKVVEDFYIQNYVFNFLIQFQYETSDLQNVDFCFSLAHTIQQCS